MKDIIISAKRQKRELKWLLLCLCIALLLNVASIIIYQTQWSELWTQGLWVLLIACLLYGLSVVVRVCVFLIRKGCGKARSKII